jgi:hypothetical protein
MGDGGEEGGVDPTREGDDDALEGAELGDEGSALRGDVHADHGTGGARKTHQRKRAGTTPTPGQDQRGPAYVVTASAAIFEGDRERRGRPVAARG